MKGNDRSCSLPVQYSTVKYCQALICVGVCCSELSINSNMNPSQTESDTFGFIARKWKPQQAQELQTLNELNERWRRSNLNNSVVGHDARFFIARASVGPCLIVCVGISLRQHVGCYHSPIYLSFTRRCGRVHVHTHTYKHTNNGGQRKKTNKETNLCQK